MICGSPGGGTDIIGGWDTGIFIGATDASTEKKETTSEIQWNLQNKLNITFQPSHQVPHKGNVYKETFLQGFLVILK